MKFTIFTISLVLITFVNSCLGQKNQEKNTNEIGSDCNCHKAFNNLVAKIETDYIAYQIAVKGKRDIEYQKQKKIFSEQAQKSSNEDCVLVLQNFVRFFRDGHLFVQQSPPLSDEDVKRLTANAEQTEWRTEAAVRSYLNENLPRLDPIEGVWYNNHGQRFGIVRDSKLNRRDFIAVLFSENVERWQPGQVKAEFKKLADGSYTDIFYSGRHFPLRLAGYLRGEQGGAALRRDGLLLHMAPVTWGKAYPLNSDEQNLIDPVDPRRPMIRLFGDSTVIVSVPSHSPEYKPLLNELVEKYRDQILKAETLIIDVRGDEGGGTPTTEILMQFLVTIAKKPAKWIGDNTMVFSSPDNIAYFKQVEKEGWLPKHLLERMQSNSGKLIVFEDEDSNSQTEKKNTEVETKFPRNVAILMDGAVVSAGEAFVLRAMKNKKVTLFGSNTGGVIDYQSVSIIQLKDCPQMGFTLGYPMFAASDRLPLGGVNATGIAPDVRLAHNIKKPFEFIVKYYKKHKIQGD